MQMGFPWLLLPTRECVSRRDRLRKALGLSEGGLEPVALGWGPGIH